MSALFRDGCLRTTIVERKRAGTHSHHCSPRRQRGMGLKSPRSTSLVRDTLPRSSSEPLCHVISTLEVLSNLVRKPVVGSMFVDSAVRVLVWKGAAVAFISVVLVALEISDEGTVLFLRQKGTPNPHSNLKSGKGAHSIAIN